MWFTFVTARLFIFLSFQPRLTATLLRSCSVVNSPTRRVGLAPMFKPASLAQARFAPVRVSWARTAALNWSQTPGLIGANCVTGGREVKKDLRFFGVKGAT